MISILGVYSLQGLVGICVESKFIVKNYFRRRK